MSTARKDTLSRIRAALDRGPLHESDAAALESRLVEPRRTLVPKRADLDGHERIALFVSMAEEAAATVARVESLAHVPGAVADFLRRENLPARAVVAPDAQLDDAQWDGNSLLEVRRGPPTAEDQVGVSGAFAGIAETGTLVLLSGADRPTTLNLLPESHVVVLHRDQIVGTYEDGWDRIRVRGSMPRTVNLVTGPSRSADIEQTLQLGAHGPRRLHIILVGHEESNQPVH